MTKKRWVTRDGRRLTPQCMTCEHLRHAIAMILRSRGWRLGWLDILTDEYLRRCKPKLPSMDTLIKEREEA